MTDDGRQARAGRRRARRALAAACAAVLGAVLPAAAGSYCRTTGTRTYCDDGRSYHRYGNDIVSGDGRRWHTFGSHTYGADGTWIARHGRGRYTASYGSDPGDEAAILPEIVERQHEDRGDRDGDGDGGD